MKHSIIAYLLLCLLSGFWSCNKEEVNPFDEEANQDGEEEMIRELDPTGIAGLHANIFGKTCANSGCHDGTFEPNFSTIESTYNTLVLHPINKNDPQGSFEYRVLPGSVEKSLLIARLTYDIDGNSGIMPLATDPSSDWPEKKDEYIGNIKTWIQNGAKDLFGNDPGIASGLPQMVGVAAKAENWLSRDDNGQGALEVPSSRTSIEIYIAFTDDDTAPTSLKENKIRFSPGKNGFENEMGLDLQILNNPVRRPGLNDPSVNYHHKITIDPRDYATTVGETVFFRAYIQDKDNPVTEIPSDFGAGYVKNYFSFKIVE